MSLPTAQVRGTEAPPAPCRRRPVHHPPLPAMLQVTLLCPAALPPRPAAGTTHNEFFTAAAPKALFKYYAWAVVGRTSTITGRTYKDDPTIMAWVGAAAGQGWTAAGPAAARAQGCCLPPWAGPALLNSRLGPTSGPADPPHRTSSMSLWAAAARQVSAGLQSRSVCCPLPPCMAARAAAVAYATAAARRMRPPLPRTHTQAPLLHGCERWLPTSRGWTPITC